MSGVEATGTRHGTSLRSEIATLGPAAVAFAGLMFLAIRGDAFPGEVLLALAAIAVCHLVPGVLVWRLVRPTDGWLVEDLAMGLAIGIALAVPFQIATVASGIGVLAWLLPLAFSALLLGIPGTRARILSREYRPLPWWWGASLSVPFVVGIVDYLNGLEFPVRWSGFAARYLDRGFHEGLVGELLHRFPIRYPWVASEEVSYHWFSHAWNANIAALSGTGIDVTLWRVSPAIIDVGAPLLVAVVAVRLTGRAWAGPLAAAVAYVAGSLEPWRLSSSATPLLFESPSEGFASLVFPALLAVIALRWSGRLGRGSTLLVLLLLLVASGSKGTTLAVLIPGLLLAAVATALFARRHLRVVLTDLALTLGTFFIAASVIFGGETKNIEVKPFAWMANRMGQRLGADTEPWTATGLALVALGVVTMLLVATAAIGALATRSGRGDPGLWLFLGASCSGVGALLLFVQVAQSHVYFYKISLIPFGLAVACAASHLAGGRSASRPLLTGLVSGAVAGAAVGFVFTRLSQVSLTQAWLSVVVVVLLATAACAVLLRGRGSADVVLATSVALVAAGMVGPVVHLVQYDRPERAVAERRVHSNWNHASDVRALRWLRDHSDVDDLVATNRHCLGATRPGCDRRRFDVAGYSERRVLVEGWAYTPKADAQYNPETGERWTEFWDTEVIEANDEFFTDPDREGREKLRELGVRWLVVDATAPHAETLEPWATLRHRTRFMTIYELVADKG